MGKKPFGSLCAIKWLTRLKKYSLFFVSMIRQHRVKGVPGLATFVITITIMPSPNCHR